MPERISQAIQDGLTERPGGTTPRVRNVARLYLQEVYFSAEASVRSAESTSPKTPSIETPGGSGSMPGKEAAGSGPQPAAAAAPPRPASATSEDDWDRPSQDGADAAEAAPRPPAVRTEAPIADQIATAEQLHSQLHSLAGQLAAAERVGAGAAQLGVSSAASDPEDTPVFASAESLGVGAAKLGASSAASDPDDSPVVAFASAASSGDDDVQELREPEAAARGIGAWERLYVEATKEGPPATKQQGPPEEVPIMVVDFGDADSEDALAETKPTPKAGAAQAPFLPREETFSPLGKKAGGAERDTPLQKEPSPIQSGPYPLQTGPSPLQKGPSLLLKEPSPLQTGLSPMPKRLSPLPKESGAEDALAETKPLLKGGPAQAAAPLLPRDETFSPLQKKGLSPPKDMDKGDFGLSDASSADSSLASPDSPAPVKSPAWGGAPRRAAPAPASAQLSEPAPAAAEDEMMCEDL